MSALAILTECPLANCPLANCRLTKCPSANCLDTMRVGVYLSTRHIRMAHNDKRRLI